MGLNVKLSNGLRRTPTRNFRRDIELGAVGFGEQPCAMEWLHRAPCVRPESKTLHSL